jgi:hypothetical protein
LSHRHVVVVVATIFLLEISGFEMIILHQEHCQSQRALADRNGSEIDGIQGSVTVFVMISNVFTMFNNTLPQTTVAQS